MLYTSAVQLPANHGLSGAANAGDVLKIGAQILTLVSVAGDVAVFDEAFVGTQVAASMPATKVYGPGQSGLDTGRPGLG